MRLLRMRSNDKLLWWREDKLPDQLNKYERYKQDPELCSHLVGEWVSLLVTDTFLVEVLDVSRDLHTPEHFFLNSKDWYKLWSCQFKEALITINRMPEGLGVLKISIYTWRNSSNTLDSFQYT
jgi:hypothetical protein